MLANIADGEERIYLDVLMDSQKFCTINKPVDPHKIKGLSACF